MAQPPLRTMTVEEFYIWQLDQDERYELVEGVPVPLRAMTGASNYHDVILVNCIAELHARLRGKPCRVASPDTALRTSIRNTRRPDVTVECAAPFRDMYDSRRPTVVVEVLSPSTRKIDRFTKLEEYKRHPALRHILLVDPDAISAKHYFRADEGAWSDVDLDGGEATIEFAAIEVEMPLGLLYDRLEMGGDGAA